MSKLQAALDLAGLGFHVFPLVAGAKVPWIDGFPTKASRDPKVIRAWWVDSVTGWEQDFNIGISTSRFGDKHALVVIDVDNKNGKHGDQTLFLRELSGDEIPDTAVALTPTGGRHIFYLVDEALRQGTNTLGDGLDVRSSGGYVVAAGSTTQNGGYGWATDCHAPVRAPSWLAVACGVRVSRGTTESPVPSIRIDQSAARDRAVSFLSAAPVAVEGDGGDAATYRVICAVKDFGVTEGTARDILLEYWNDRCAPPWDADELAVKVANAYRYGSSVVGAAAPETTFAPIPGTANPAAGSAPAKALHPFDKLNDEFAFVLAGGGSHVLWETVDEKGCAKIEHLSESAFHKKHAAWTLQVGKKHEPVTELWMKDKRRRSYDGFCFAPGEDVPPAFYNLWRGFAVQPADSDEQMAPECHAAVDAFFEHARENVCGGDEKLFNWLIGYFAHLVQRPHEKPLVALVFKGSKGVGKNALIRCVAHLLGRHALLTANRRYLVGNFNGHLESLLLFTLDEAFWSGDKQAEGTLKDLITGDKHVVEHKGKEPFTVDNKCRVVIIGNEDWLAPASHDERRFAVFNVGDGRKQDRNFFENMCTGMDAGGYALLLRRLLDFDVSRADVNAAPRTAGLLEQKHESLEPLKQWWLECLTEGVLVGSDFPGQWPLDVETERFRIAFRRYVKDRNIRSRVPDGRQIGKLLTQCVPSAGKKRMRIEGALVYSYILPPLEDCRKAWATFIGHEIRWD